MNISLDSKLCVLKELFLLKLVPDHGKDLISVPQSPSECYYALIRLDDIIR